MKDYYFESRSNFIKQLKCVFEIGFLLQPEREKKNISKCGIGAKRTTFESSVFSTRNTKDQTDNSLKNFFFSVPIYAAARVPSALSHCWQDGSAPVRLLFCLS